MVKTILTTILFAAALAACQGPEPTARNQNGTLALAENVLSYNRTTPEVRAFYGTPDCLAVNVGTNGCDVVIVTQAGLGGDSAGAAAGK